MSETTWCGFGWTAVGFHNTHRCGENPGHETVHICGLCGVSPDSPHSHPVGGEEEDNPFVSYALDGMRFKGAQWAHDRIMARLRSLRSSLATVSRDKERLDWLEATHTVIDTPELLEEIDKPDARPEGQLWFAWNQPPKTLREAIDAARRAPRPEETET